MTELTITDSALILAMSYNQVMRLVLLGEIRSRRTSTGRFLVLREDVERLAQSRSIPAGAA